MTITKWPSPLKLISYFIIKKVSIKWFKGLFVYFKLGINFNVIWSDKFEAINYYNFERASSNVLYSEIYFKFIPSEQLFTTQLNWTTFENIFKMKIL